MKTGFDGTFVIPWSQTELDGIPAAPLDDLVPGTTWRWSGTAFRLDGRDAILHLRGAAGPEEIRRRAARKVHRLFHLAAAPAASQADAGEMEANWADPCFVLSDGLRSYAATLLPVRQGSELLLVFTGPLPPRDRNLWVLRCAPDPDFAADGIGVGTGRRKDRAMAEELSGFTPGTRIATPSGPRPVEALVPGDLVLTRDHGARPLLWAGQRQISGARLHGGPVLRPVRLRAGALGTGAPDGDLLVSPHQRILLGGARAAALFGTSEVLVRAVDLVDGRSILTDRSLGAVTYVHLLCEHHAIIRANGVEAESFLPTPAHLAGMPPDQRSGLLRLLPGLAHDPETYGMAARRRLSMGEAAILRHDLAA